MIGGMSRVVQDVPPFCLAAGTPLSVYDINRIGLRRRGFDSATRMRIREMYRMIYDSGLTIREGLKEVERLYGDDDAAREILSFASAAIRGLAPRAGRARQGAHCAGENAGDSEID
jgi:UDP-N-acetylglucosamine acyltransferase